MTRHLVRGDPLKATPADAVGDAVLQGNRDAARDQLVRRLQFRRLQSMIAALKEVGGLFIPESAHYLEGDHLHVSFGDPPPEAPEAAPLPGEAPVPPGPTGLIPANPNQIHHK